MDAGDADDLRLDRNAVLDGLAAVPAVFLSEVKGSEAGRAGSGGEWSPEPVGNPASA